MALRKDQSIKMPIGNDHMIFYLFDKWALIGFSGFLLNIFSLVEGAELPDITGFSGLLIVGVAVYQKVRDDMRKQETHKKKMQLLDKILASDKDIDQETISLFLQEQKK